MTERDENPDSQKQLPCVKLALTGGDRLEWEREFVHIACVGSNAEFSAAVDRLAHRASLKTVLESVIDPTNEADAHSGYLPKNTAPRSHDEAGE